MNTLISRLTTTIAVLVAVWVGGLVCAVAQAAPADGVLSLEAQRKPDKPWKRYDTQTLEHLLGDQLVSHRPPALSKYGGLLSQQHEATGSFYVKRIGSRWWFIDPLGHPMIRMGLNSVYRRFPNNEIEAHPQALRDHLEANGGGDWAAAAVPVLRDLGFNGLGRWSEHEVFTKTGSRYPYTTSLKFMADFGRHLGITHPRYGNMGYRQNCIPVFHPDFPAFCDTYAKDAVAGRVDDPYLVGHYTDNELPVPRNLLVTTLKLDPADEVLKYNHREAWRWYRDRRGPDALVENATKQDQEAYLGHVFDRYYELTTAALRRHDPNHLVLGSRLHGAGLKVEPVVRAAGHHVDVLSFNTYGYWAVPDELWQQWKNNADRPFLISEFYVKGEDTGLANDKGAGWIVRTQCDRGAWYQHFVIALLRSESCVGWDYFKYRDDIDVNKGVLTADLKPHRAFYDALKQTHEAVYLTIEHLDQP